MKRVSLIAGWALLAFLWVLVLPASDRNSFTVHMTVHMGVVAGVAPLIAIGLSGGRFDVTRHSRWFTPLLASLLELFAVWGWHLPAMRALSEGSVTFAVIEQITFLVAGLLLWLSCLGGAARGNDEKRLAGTVGLLFTSMHMTLLGALLTLSPRPLYGESDVSCFGIPLSAAGDQQVGGVVMLLVGAVVYLAGGVALLAGTLQAPAAEPGKGAGG